VCTHGAAGAEAWFPAFSSGASAPCAGAGLAFGRAPCRGEPLARTSAAFRSAGEATPQPLGREPLRPGCAGAGWHQDTSGILRSCGFNTQSAPALEYLLTVHKISLDRAEGLNRMHLHARTGREGVRGVCFNFNHK